MVQEIRLRNTLWDPVCDESGVPLNSVDDEPCLGQWQGTKLSAWFVNGVLHRENDLPAVIFDEERRMIWYFNGKTHRAGDKPAMRSGDGSDLGWFVHGLAHRVNGPYISIGKDRHKYGLYDFDLPQSEHAAVLNMSKHYNCPLWVSLLVILKIIDLNDVTIFLDSSDQWKCDLPIEWVLRTWGVDDNTMITTLGARKYGSASFSNFVDKLVTITEFMESELSKGRS